MILKIGFLNDKIKEYFLNDDATLEDLFYSFGFLNEYQKNTELYAIYETQINGKVTDISEERVEECECYDGYVYIIDKIQFTEQEKKLTKYLEDNEHMSFDLYGLTGKERKELLSNIIKIAKED